MRMRITSERPSCPVCGQGGDYPRIKSLYQLCDALSCSPDAPTSTIVAKVLQLRTDKNPAAVLTRLALSAREDADRRLAEAEEYERLAQEIDSASR